MQFITRIKWNRTHTAPQPPHPHTVHTVHLEQRLHTTSEPHYPYVSILPIYHATASQPTHHTTAPLPTSIGAEPHTKTQPHHPHTSVSLRTSNGAEPHTTSQPQYPHLMEHSRLIINIIKPPPTPRCSQHSEPSHPSLLPFNIPTTHSFLSLSSHLFLNPKKYKLLSLSVSSQLFHQLITSLLALLLFTYSPILHLPTASFSLHLAKYVQPFILPPFLMYIPTLLISLHLFTLFLTLRSPTSSQYPCVHLFSFITSSNLNHHPGSYHLHSHSSFSHIFPQ
jgi:hypothetical protein